jgi:transposase
MVCSNHMPTKSPISTRRVHTPQFKLTVTLEAMQKQDMAGVARRYGITHGLLTKWKQHVVTHGHRLFETTPNKEIIKLQKRVAQLEQMIGQREVELALLKNFSDFYASPNTS